MSETMILHHYEMSPYAEKIRLMFGYKGMAWQSVLSPEQPPRPNVDPLAGGYRRIPVAQIGADVFCDTRIISQEVARLADAPELDPEGVSEAAAEVIATAQGDVFFAAIGSVSPLTLLGTMLRGLGLFGTLRFARDRAGMLSGGTARPPQGAAAGVVWRSFLEDLERRLADQDYVVGDSPSLADFCAFHPIFLHVTVSRGPVDARYHNVGRWYERMAALGHGRRDEVGPEAAFEAARQASPRPLPVTEGDADERIGRRVSVAPSDYGSIPVTGTLVAGTPSRLILARQTDRFGTVHVHFPRIGYSIVDA
jgi:glutathione S-transferase